MKEEIIEVQNTKKPIKRKTKIIATILAGVMLITGGYLAKKNNTMEKLDQRFNFTMTYLYKTPFDTFGEFTNVFDDEEVMARAQWYYDTYIANPEKKPAGKKYFNVKEIANDIRIINGQFMINKNGDIDYSEYNILGVANDLCMIANYDSLTEYGNNVFYTPMAPLFVDGSLEQSYALEIDVKMNQIVEAMHNNDIESFTKLTKEWYTTVYNIFSSMSERKIDPVSSLMIYHGTFSKYHGTIEKFIKENNLEVNVDFFNPETQKIKEVNILDPMNYINEVAVNEEGQTLAGQLYNESKEYFDEKYENNQEIGKSKVLK